MATFAGTQQKCMACDKTVYLVDKLTADNRIFHKACFRCHHCRGTLKVIIPLCVIYLVLCIYFVSCIIFLFVNGYVSKLYIDYIFFVHEPRSIYVLKRSFYYANVQQIVEETIQKLPLNFWDVNWFGRSTKHVKNIWGQENATLSWYW